MTSAAAGRGHEVRQRLLAAAVELVPERGWTAVSTRILAERAGVTPSVVHYHFASLQALLREAALGAMRGAVAQLDALFDTAHTADDLVEAMVASLDSYTGADPMSLLFIEAYLAGLRHQQFGEEIAGLLAGARMRFARQLAECGVPASDETAAALLAALDGLVLQRGLGIAPHRTAAATVLRRLVTEREEASERWVTG